MLNVESKWIGIFFLGCASAAACVAPGSDSSSSSITIGNSGVTGGTGGLNGNYVQVTTSCNLGTEHLIAPRVTTLSDSIETSTLTLADGCVITSNSLLALSSGMAGFQSLSTACGAPCSGAECTPNNTQGTMVFGSYTQSGNGVTVTLSNMNCDGSGQNDDTEIDTFIQQ